MAQNKKQKGRAPPHGPPPVAGTTRSGREVMLTQVMQESGLAMALLQAANTPRGQALLAGASVSQLVAASRRQHEVTDSQADRILQQVDVHQPAIRQTNLCNASTPVAEQTARRLFNEQQLNEPDPLPAMTNESASPGRRAGNPPHEDDDEDAHDSPDPDDGNNDDDDESTPEQGDNPLFRPRMMALNEEHEEAGPSSRGVRGASTNGRQKQPIRRRESSPPAIHMPVNVPAGPSAPAVTTAQNDGDARGIAALLAETVTDSLYKLIQSKGPAVVFPGMALPNSNKTSNTLPFANPPSATSPNRRLVAAGEESGADAAVVLTPAVGSKRPHDSETAMTLLWEMVQHLITQVALIIQRGLSVSPTAPTALTTPRRDWREWQVSMHV